MVVEGFCRVCLRAGAWAGALGWPLGWPVGVI